ncbi:MAG: response regulator [Chloracidobacterium sp.]|nr:response regulator [Chloracidobacterium sp.]MDW8218558.1 response regulator [Acidobacteriota bacterium]
MSHVPPPTDENLARLPATPLPFNVLRSLSHELRAPLSAILGWTEWLAEKAGEAEQWQEGIQHIRSAAERMLQLLDDYSDLARLGEQDESTTAATELLTALRRICYGLELVARQQRQTLRIGAEDQVPSVMLSSIGRQALWLVVRSMLRAAPEGTTITISADQREKVLQLSVSSDQALDESVTSGALNLARLLMTRDGGALTLERATDGWRIVLQVPTTPSSSTVGTPTFAYPPDASSGSSEVLSGVTQAAPSTGAAAKKVLVIDDDENLLKLLGAVVSAAGYKTYLATSGARGLEAARALSPDIVLLDIGMPGMDGFATFNALRVEPCLAHAKIIALTAYTSTSERERIARHGFDGFIPKPFKREQLIQVLSELSV